MLSFWLPLPECSSTLEQASTHTHVEKQQCLAKQRQGGGSWNQSNGSMSVQLLAFSVIPPKNIAKINVKELYPYVFFQEFYSSVFTSYLIHFELISVESTRIPLHVNIQFSQHYLLFSLLSIPGSPVKCQLIGECMDLFLSSHFRSIGLCHCVSCRAHF